MPYARHADAAAADATLICCLPRCFRCSFDARVFLSPRPFDISLLRHYVIRRHTFFMIFTNRFFAAYFFPRCFFAFSLRFSLAAI